MLLKVGWMHKHRRLLSLNWWNHYWFVLNQVTCSLTYYKSPQTLSREGEYILTGSQVVATGNRVGIVRLPPWLSKENVIQVTTGKKKIMLCCNNRADAKSWKELIDTFRPEFFPYRQRLTAMLLNQTVAANEDPMTDFKHFGFDGRKSKNIEDKFRTLMEDYNLTMDHEEDRKGADENLGCSCAYGGFPMNYYQPMASQLASPMALQPLNPMLPFSPSYPFSAPSSPSLLALPSPPTSPPLSQSELLSFMTRLVHQMSPQHPQTLQHPQALQHPQPPQALQTTQFPLAQAHEGALAKRRRKEQALRDDSTKIDATFTEKVSGAVCKKMEGNRGTHACKDGGKDDLDDVIGFLTSYQSNKDLKELEQELSKTNSRG